MKIFIFSLSILFFSQGCSGRSQLAPGEIPDPPKELWIIGELPKEEAILETLKMINERLKTIFWTIKIEPMK